MQAGAADGEDPVQLGEAEVVTDGQPDVEVADRRGDDVLARLLVGGLAVGDPARVDVEHVDLAVDREVLAVGADQDRGVEGLLAVADALGDRARQQVDAERPRPAAGGGQARAVERLGARREVLPGREQVPLLRQRDELRPVGRGGADQPSAAARLRALSALELSCTAATRMVVFGTFAARPTD